MTTWRVQVRYTKAVSVTELSERTWQRMREDRAVTPGSTADDNSVVLYSYARVLEVDVSGSARPMWQDVWERFDDDFEEIFDWKVLGLTISR